MKKTIIALGIAAFAFAACNKENVAPVAPQQEGIDASKVVFNITITTGDETKAVKTGWTNGDKVYLFFEDNTNAYVTLIHDRTSWGEPQTAKLSNTGADLSLGAGKKVTAVFLPFNTDTPTYDGAWKFKEKGSYYMASDPTVYDITIDNDIATVSVTLPMNAPEGCVQFLLPADEDEDELEANKYVLLQKDVTPIICGTIAPGGDVSRVEKPAGYAMQANVVTGVGYYFYGTVSGEVSDPKFDLVEQDPEKGYAIGTQSKTFTDKTISVNSAIKFSSAFGDQEPFVSLGYENGPLWATGNLDKTNSKIVGPLEAGEYFMYGHTTPYNSSDTSYDGTETHLSADYDVACKVNGTWSIPESAQFSALFNTDNTYREWKTGWTNLGDEKGGYLVTSKKNGIALFFPAAGFYSRGEPNNVGSGGYYWSSTSYPDSGELACYLDFYPSEFCSILY